MEPINRAGLGMSLLNTVDPLNIGQLAFSQSAVFL